MIALGMQQRDGLRRSRELALTIFSARTGAARIRPNIRPSPSRQLPQDIKPDFIGIEELVKEIPGGRQAA